jgi:hypothetical protein
LFLGLRDRADSLATSAHGQISRRKEQALNREVEWFLARLERVTAGFRVQRNISAVTPFNSPLHVRAALAHGEGYIFLFREPGVAFPLVLTPGYYISPRRGFGFVGHDGVRAGVAMDLKDVKDKKSSGEWIAPRLFVCEVFGGPERNAGEVPKPGSFFVFLLLFGVVSVNGVFRELTVGGGAAGQQAGKQKQRECLWPAHGVSVREMTATVDVEMNALTLASPI